METPNNLLIAKLQAARTRYRLLTALSGLFWTLSLSILFIIIGFYVDRYITLSYTGRVVWHDLLIALALLSLAITLAAALLRKLPDKQLAVRVERRFPVFAERLLTSLSLMPALASDAASFSPTLAQSLLRETHQIAADLDFRKAVNTTPLQRATLVAFACLLLLLLHILLAGQAFGVWILRLSYPKQDIAPFAATRLQVLPEQTLLPEGASTWITIKTWGKPATQCTLRIHRQTDPPDIWQTIALDRPTTIQTAGSLKSSLFRYRLAHLTQSVSLVALANDGRSNTRDITVVPLPTIVNVRLRIQFPAYTHRPPQIINAPTGSFTALKGSYIQVSATTNTPLRSALCYLNGVPSAWHIAGKTLSGAFNVMQNGTYRFILTDQHGFTNPNSPTYTIRMERDQPPSVQIQRPATDLDLVPNGSLPLVAHASDDFGIDRMDLNYQKAHQDPTQLSPALPKGAPIHQLPLPGPTGAPSADIRLRWHLASIQPHVGDVITYNVSATDNDAVDGPHTTTSLSYHIHIVSVPEMQQRLKEALDEEQHALEELRRTQNEAQQQTQQARLHPAPDRISQAAQTQMAASEQARSLAQEVQNLTQQLQNNELATPSELNRRQQAADALQAQANQKMPATAQTLQQAESAKAPQRLDNLNQAGRQQNSIQKELDRIQQLLSRTPSADQLAQKAASLAQQQQQLADSSRAIAEDLRSNNKTMAPEDKMGLQVERQQQAQVNKETQQLEQQLRRAAQSAQERGDQQTAQALKQAEEALKQGQVHSNQQQAQQNLQQNNPQNAAPHQDRAAQALQKAAEAAQQAAGQQNQMTSAEQLEQEAQRLQELAQQQRRVANQIQQHPDSSQSHALSRQEQQIQRQAQQAQNALQGVPQAQQNLQNAQQNLQQSGQQLQQNRPQQAQSPANQAAQDLQKAAQNAQRAAQQLRQIQAAQQLAEKVQELAQLQHGLLDTTRRLDKAAQQGNLDSNDMRERRQVGARQEDAENQANELAGKFPSPAFQRAMRMAAGQMDKASKNLNQDEPNTGTSTQQAQENAARTLDAIAKALQMQAQNSSGQQQADQQNGQEGANAAQQDEMAETLGELMLGRSLQNQLRQETGQLDRERNQRPDHSLSPQQQQQAEHLDRGQQMTEEITNGAAQHLQQMPDAQRAAQQAGQHMQRAEQQLSQKQTGRPTQEQQDQALHNLDQAIQQVQQALQQQQQQQQAMQQAMQGAPRPMQRPGSQPQMQPFTRLEGVQRGALFSPNMLAGKPSLDPRAQRALQQGRREKIPPEFQDFVYRYYESLAEKKGK